MFYNQTVGRHFVLAGGSVALQTMVEIIVSEVQV
jgi:hypothetical protein